MFVYSFNIVGVKQVKQNEDKKRIYLRWKRRKRKKKENIHLAAYNFQ